MPCLLFPENINYLNNYLFYYNFDNFIEMLGCDAIRDCSRDSIWLVIKCQGVPLHQGLGTD